MRGNEFLDNMELVDAAYVEAADTTPKRKTWIRWTAMVASLCLVVGALFGFGLLKYPGVEPDVEPDIEYYALHDLLNRDDFASIIWGASGDNTSSDEDPNQSGSGDGDYFPEDGNWVEWNGIKISTGLQSAINQLKAEDLVAIGVESWADPSLIYDDYVELDDYVYNGKTYYEIRTEYAQVQEQHDALVTLKKFSNYYDEWDGKDVEEFWAKLYDIVPEDTVLKYFQGDKATGKFDTTAISNDLNATETEKLQLENDMAACRREYHTKFSAVPELSQMMNKGYYVVGNNRVFAVILPIGQLSQFAKDVKEVFAKEVIDTVMFRMATQNELGVGEPLDDEPAILPGGVVEEPNIPDDVTVEDVPVDDEEKD